MDPKIGSFLALYETCAFIVACYNYSLELVVQTLFKANFTFFFPKNFIFFAVSILERFNLKLPRSPELITHGLEHFCLLKEQKYLNDR
ncbi:hypothetical protein BpHYR1_033715, partial [Brachionus plicatilis]